MKSRLARMIAFLCKETQGSIVNVGNMMKRGPFREHFANMPRPARCQNFGFLLDLEKNSN